MSHIETFFAMGGYAEFVWPAYAVTAIVLVGLLIASLWAMRTREAELEVLRTASGDRRVATTTASDATESSLGEA